MDKFIQWLKDIYHPIRDWLMGWTNLDAMGAKITIGTVFAVLVVLIIVLIVLLCVKHSKKKKALSSNKVETKAEEVEVKEEKKEEPKVEEKVQEVKPVEKPVETKVEETKEEVKKVEPVVVKQEPKKTAPVAPKKRATKAEKKVVAKDLNKEVSIEAEKQQAPVAPETRDPKKEVPVKRTLGKFTISQEGENFRYRLKASNGEILVVSELYASRLSCRKGITTIKNNAETATIEVVEDKHGLFSFRVMTKQGRCLATSANYKAKNSALSAIESFKNFVKTQRIEDDENAVDHYTVDEFNENVIPEPNGKFKVVAQGDGFVYQLVASNGQVIAVSQIYKTVVSCKEGLEKFRKLAYQGTFLIFEDKNGKFQFKLYNKQKRLVLAGEVYDAKARVISAIESIKRFAKLAEVVEEEQE